MNARVLLILLIITVLLALTRRFRRVGVSLSVILMVLMVWQVVNTLPGAISSVTASSSTTATSVASAPINAVRLNRAELSGNGAPWRLTGELVNTAAVSINAVKIVITRRSCASADAQPDSCSLLWQGQHTLRIKLLPGASQSFEESIWSHTSVPRQVGIVRDSFMLADVVTAQAN